MNIKNYYLSHYHDATDEMHIHKVEHAVEAQKPHMHEYFQIYFMIKGSLTHYIGNLSSSLHRGDMFIIPPHKQHYIRENKKDAVFYSFSFMPDFFGETDKCNNFAISFLRNLNAIGENQILPKITIGMEEMLYIETIMECIYKEFTVKSIGATEIIRAYTVILLTYFARVYFESTAESSSPDQENIRQYLLNGIQYIDVNFFNALSLTEIAKRSAMSKSCFCSMFSSLTGYTFNKYLNKKRIEHAVMLIQKGYKLTGIYGLCGYSDYSTFSRNFKRINGLSPSQYKKQCR